MYVFFCRDNAAPECPVDSLSTQSLAFGQRVSLSVSRTFFASTARPFARHSGSHQHQQRGPVHQTPPSPSLPAGSTTTTRSLFGPNVHQLQTCALFFQRLTRVILHSETTCTIPFFSTSSFPVVLKRVYSFKWEIAHISETEVEMVRIRTGPLYHHGGTREKRRDAHFGSGGEEGGIFEV